MSAKCCARFNTKTTNATLEKATVLLMLDLGETPPKVAVCLGIDGATVYPHLENQFMKKKVLKNKFHGTANGFRTKVEEFFDKIAEYKTELETLLTCNFGVITLSQSIF